MLAGACQFGHGVGRFTINFIHSLLKGVIWPFRVASPLFLFPPLLSLLLPLPPPPFRAGIPGFAWLSAKNNSSNTEKKSPKKIALTREQQKTPPKSTKTHPKKHKNTKKDERNTKLFPRISRAKKNNQLPALAQISQKRRNCRPAPPFSEFGDIVVFKVGGFMSNSSSALLFSSPRPLLAGVYSHGVGGFRRNTTIIILRRFIKPRIRHTTTTTVRRPPLLRRLALQ